MALEQWVGFIKAPVAAGSKGRIVGRSYEGRPMALGTTTFVFVFVAALALMGLVAWLRFRFENNKRS